MTPLVIVMSVQSVMTRLAAGLESSPEFGGGEGTGGPFGEDNRVRCRSV